MFLEALALAADAARLPRYRPGDAFVFSDGRVEQVERVERSGVTWRGLSGPSYTRSRNFVVPVLRWRAGAGYGRRTVIGEPGKLWPANRTQSVRFRVVAETRLRPDAGWRRAVTLWTCRSQRPRTISIRLGEFRTIPFACDRFSATNMRPIERLEWDYAPEIGHYVRRSSVDYIRGSRRTIELVATLAGPAANRRRLTALSRNARREDMSGRAN